MYELEALTGRVIEARCCVNRIPSRRDDDPPRERRELWLADASIHGDMIVAYSQCMPARADHAVTIIRFEGRGAGLYNLSTAVPVNFVQVDPAPLLRRFDVAIVVF